MTPGNLEVTGQGENLCPEARRGKLTLRERHACSSPQPACCGTLRIIAGDNQAFLGTQFEITDLISELVGASIEVLPTLGCV